MTYWRQLRNSILMLRLGNCSLRLESVLSDTIYITWGFLYKVWWEKALVKVGGDGQEDVCAWGVGSLQLGFMGRRRWGKGSLFLCRFLRWWWMSIILCHLEGLREGFCEAWVWERNDGNLLSLIRWWHDSLFLKKNLVMLICSLMQLPCCTIMSLFWVMHLNWRRIVLVGINVEDQTVREFDWVSWV